MKRVTTFLFATAMFMSIFLGGGNPIKAETPSGTSARQIVPETKKVSKRVYSKSRRVTETTYKHGKKYTKKAYQKGRWVTVTTYKHGKRYTKKVWRKGHDIVMGPTTRKG